MCITTMENLFESSWEQSDFRERSLYNNMNMIAPLNPIDRR